MSAPLIHGVVYVVRAGGTDGTLHAGDRVSLLPDGTLMNLTAGGWLEASEVAEVMPGATFEPCSMWIERARKRADAYADVLRQIDEAAA